VVVEEVVVVMVSQREGERMLAGWLCNGGGNVYKLKWRNKGRTDDGREYGPSGQGRGKSQARF